MSRSCCGYFTRAFFLLHPPGVVTACSPGARAPRASGWDVKNRDKTSISDGIGRESGPADAFVLCLSQSISITCDAVNNLNCFRFSAK